MQLSNEQRMALVHARDALLDRYGHRHAPAVHVLEAEARELIHRYREDRQRDGFGVEPIGVRIEHDGGRQLPHVPGGRAADSHDHARRRGRMIWRVFAHPIEARGGKPVAPMLAMHIVHTLRGEAQSAPICETPAVLHETTGKLNGYVLACTRCLAFTDRILERAR